MLELVDNRRLYADFWFASTSCVKVMLFIFVGVKN